MTSETGKSCRNPGKVPKNDVRTGKNWGYPDSSDSSDFDSPKGKHDIPRKCQKVTEKHDSPGEKHDIPWEKHDSTGGKA